MLSRRSWISCISKFRRRSRSRTEDPQVTDDARDHCRAIHRGECNMNLRRIVGVGDWCDRLRECNWVLRDVVAGKHGCLRPQCVDHVAVQKRSQGCGRWLFGEIQAAGA